jgi:hypothetical protein
MILEIYSQLPLKVEGHSHLVDSIMEIKTTSENINV